MGKTLLLLVSFSIGFFIVGPQVFDKEPEKVIVLDTELHEELIRRTDLLSTVFNREMTEYVEFSVDVTVTAYSANESECDSSPWVTASGELSRVGILALSRDLIEDFGLNDDDTALLMVDGECLGTFRLEDKMSTHKRKGSDRKVAITRTVDILMGNKRAASLWGVKKGRLIWVRGKDE